MFHHLAEGEALEGKERALTVYGVPLFEVTSFNYRGRVQAIEEDYWPSVVRNLRSARKMWVQLTQILIKDVADAHTLVQIYLAVVQSVLLYRSETWVLAPRMQRVMGGFHHRVTCRLTGRQPRN